MESLKKGFFFPPHELFSSESTPIKRKVQGKVHYIRKERWGEGRGRGLLEEKKKKLTEWGGDF